MDVLFQNKYAKTEQWIKECNQYSFFRRPIMLVFYIWGALMLCYGLYEVLFLRIVNIPAFLAPLFFYAVVLLSYFRANKMTAERNREIYGDDDVVVTEVTDDCIRQHLSNGAQFTIPYTSIKRCALSRHYILLVSDAKILYTLKINGFTIGNADDFFVFLQSKGIKVK